MGTTIIHGTDEKGLFITEHKSTPVLITELISNYPKMCPMDIYKALCEIREASERDERIRETYAACLKKGDNADEAKS